MKLEGKVAIVTGGARDIGRSVSVKLAREGAKVIVNFHSSREAAEKVVAEIQTAGGQALAVQGDMTQAGDVANLVSETRRPFGDHIHILVNVVGGMVARKTLDVMDEDFFNQVMHLNVTSVFLAMKAVTPHMPAGGAVVNLASLAGRDGGGPGASAYAASKGAVMTFTRAMAKELGPKGIRVNALCPGLIGTTFHDIFTQAEVRARVAGATPLRREGNPDECADAVAFLVSNESSFITGANIDINGGLGFS